MKNLIGAVVLVLIAHDSIAQPPGVPPVHEEVPPQQGGQAGHGHGHGKPLQFASEVHNADHILEHLERVISTKKKEDMTEEELEFHYFKLHDYDNNNKLDGVEIGKALTHFHDEKTAAQMPLIQDDMIELTVDSTMNLVDTDHDGYLTYSEMRKNTAIQKAKIANEE